MIICGFPGIGKSFVAKNYHGFVDLESTPFKKNWNLYTDVAIHMNNNGYHVLMSSHKEVRDMLLSKNVGFSVIIPLIEDKETYMKRYKTRGNTEEFIKFLDENYEKFITEIMDDKRLNVLTLPTNRYLAWYLNRKLDVIYGAYNLTQNCLYGATYMGQTVFKTCT